MHFFAFVLSLAFALAAPIAQAENCKNPQTQQYESSKDSAGVAELKEPEDKLKEARKDLNEAEAANNAGQASDTQGASKMVAAAQSGATKTTGQSEGLRPAQQAQPEFQNAMDSHQVCVDKAQDGLNKVREAEEKIFEVKGKYQKDACTQTNTKADQLKSQADALKKELKEIKAKCQQDKKNSEKQKDDAKQAEQNKNPQSGQQPQPQKPEDKKPEEEDKEEDKDIKNKCENGKVPTFNSDGSLKTQSKADSSLDTNGFASASPLCQPKPTSFDSPKTPGPDKKLKNPADFCKELNGGVPTPIDSTKGTKDSSNIKFGADGNPLCSEAPPAIGEGEQMTEAEKSAAAKGGPNKDEGTTGTGANPDVKAVTMNDGQNNGPTSAEGRKLVGSGADSMKGSGGGAVEIDEKAAEAGSSRGIASSSAALPWAPSTGLINFPLPGCKPPVYMAFQYSGAWCRGGNYNQLLMGANFNRTIDAAATKGCKLSFETVSKAVIDTFTRVLGPSSGFCKKSSSFNEILNSK